MTRARVFFATSATYRAAVEAEIRDVLVRPRDPVKLLRDVADMRERLAREKPAECLWSLKQLRGGMVDIEFIQQYLTLRHAAEHPEILSSNTSQALANLAAAGVLDAAIERRLSSTLKFWHALQGMLSLTVEDDPTPERVAEFPEALKSRLAKAGGAGDFKELETVMHFNAAEAYGLFQDLIEAPAQALPKPAEDDEEAPVPLI